MCTFLVTFTKHFGNSMGYFKGNHMLIGTSNECTAYVTGMVPNAFNTCCFSPVLLWYVSSAHRMLGTCFINVNACDCTHCRLEYSTCFSKPNNASVVAQPFCSASGCFFFDIWGACKRSLDHVQNEFLVFFFCFSRLESRLGHRTRERKTQCAPTTRTKCKEKMPWQPQRV